MDLPLDARTRPFREKYIDEETPMFRRWMLFGVEQDGTVHVCDGDGDSIISGLTVGEAMRITEARHIFVNTVLDVLNPKR